MTHDLRRISLFGIVFLVLLRICIGWQFLYEGLWKYQTQSTGNPWTAKGYLMNAQGPFRWYFRGLVDDPDDLNWLDYEHMKDDWDTWKERFISHYELDEEQQQSLNELLYGLERYEVKIRLPEGKEEFNSRIYGPTLVRVFVFEPPKGPDEPGTLYLKDGEKIEELYIVRFHGIVPVEGNEEYHDAIDKLWDKYTTASKVYAEELKALLADDKGLTGEPLKDSEGNIIEDPPGEIVVYKQMLADYEEGLANANRESNYDHLQTLWGDIQRKRAELVNPVKKLDADLKEDAYKLLTAEQRQTSPMPPEPTRLAAVDQRTIWALMILGGLLIAGLFTRVAAFLGAGLVLMFYLANPPWPGVPPAPGPEHSFIVDKNLIEIAALVALAWLPTGSWFGVDGIFRRLFSGERKEKKAKPAGKAPEQKPVPVKT